MKLIGLAGKARSGKDTVANFWKQERRVITYALADPVRHAAAAMFSRDFDYFTDANPNREEKDAYWGISPRRMLQLIGTECGREVFFPDIWTKNATLRLNAATAENMYASIPEQYFIVTDIRFEDEAKWIRENNGTLIHIRRDTSDVVASHKSERGVLIDPSEYIINNNGSVTDLYLSVQNIITMLEAVV